MTAFLRRFAMPLVLLAGVALVALWHWRADQLVSRDNHRLRAQLVALERQRDADVHALATATAAAQRLAVEYRADTVTLTRTVTRWRDVAVPQTARETVLVAAADTAVLACTAALRTCEQRVAAAESVGVAWVALVRTDSARAVTQVRLAEREAAARRAASAKRRSRLMLLGAAVAGAVTVRILTP